MHQIARARRSPPSAGVVARRESTPDLLIQIPPGPSCAGVPCRGSGARERGRIGKSREAPRLPVTRPERAFLRRVEGFPRNADAGSGASERGRIGKSREAPRLPVHTA